MGAIITRATNAVWTWLGLGLTALLTVGPLVLEPRPVAFLAGPSDLGRIGVAFALLLVVAVRAWLDRRQGEFGWATLAFAVVAAALTAVHWFMVDRIQQRADFQRDYYVRIFNHTADAPHNFRPLPYGFARLIERLTGDWWFSCFAYRWFFTFWFVWAAYRLARLVHDRRRALLTLLPLVALYPSSVAFYFGQLTDPLSHALFVLAVIYVVEDRVAELAAALALGVMAKETAVLVVPGYFACYWRRGWKSWAVTAALGAACVGTYLAVRVPAGWTAQRSNINGLNGLMIGSNLGIGHQVALTSVPQWELYAHPLLFIGSFVPFIAWRWRTLDVRLRTICVVLTPLVFASNLCFGWLYESRNYMPLVPLLATLAIPPRETASVSARSDTASSACG